MRYCKYCNVHKELIDFKATGKPKSDGTRYRSNKCRECTNKDKRAKREEYNRVNGIVKKEMQTEEDKKAYHRQYYKDNKEKIREKQRAYSRTDEGKRARLTASRKYRSTELGSLKQRARAVVNHGIRDGKITKPDNCTKCRIYAPLEAHHKDYNKPSEVDWLCKQCHEDTHHLNEGHESI